MLLIELLSRVQPVLQSLSSFACRDEEKPNECESTINRILGALCSIGGDRADCAKAEEFIKEHMKN